MKTLPLGSHYHQRGLDQIARANSLDDLVRRQRKQVREAVWLPIIAFLCGSAWVIWTITAAAAYFGWVK